MSPILPRERMLWGCRGRCLGGDGDRRIYTILAGSLACSLVAVEGWAGVGVLTGRSGWCVRMDGEMECGG